MAIAVKELVLGDFDAAAPPFVKLTEEKLGRPLTQQEEEAVRAVCARIKQRQRAVTHGLDKTRIVRGSQLFCDHYFSDADTFAVHDRGQATDLLHFFECKLRDSPAPRDRAAYEQYRDAALAFLAQFKDRHSIATTPLA